MGVMHKTYFHVSAFFAAAALLSTSMPAAAAYRFADFQASPPIHVYRSAAATPAGLTPDQIKSIYHLPAKGGQGTIAIIGAYDDAAIEADLNVVSAAFGLSKCTAANGCFEKHALGKTAAASADWALETSLDVEWAHAIAPGAKILLVEAPTPSGANLLSAIDYARSRSDVVAVSMSWGGAEFSDETSLDSHFTSTHSITFFASSGDQGAGVSWPAASPNVVGVGGTSLVRKAAGSVVAENAWSGSGGGVSAYEPEPGYQKAYSIPRAGGHRAVPDVSYDADPASGFSIYRSTPSTVNSTKGWYVVGGTSAGAPQWAAIKALGSTASNAHFYADKASADPGVFFRDIISGANGTCAYYCAARARYDYVTGLGSPLTFIF
jgi:subtilase family serine protease